MKLGEGMRPARRAGVAFAVVILVASLAGVQSSGLASTIDTGPQFSAGGSTPSSGNYVAWRDEFVDMSNVAAFSGVAFNGADVRLPAGNLSRRGMVVSTGPGWDSAAVVPWSVLHEGSTFKLWYGGSDGGTSRAGYAVSPDGMT